VAKHNVLVTGAAGFIGRYLCPCLAKAGFRVVPTVRPGSPLNPYPQAISLDLCRDGQCRKALAGIDCVVHLAARVHVMHEQADDPLAQYRAVNVEGTLRLARQAAALGVRRFIFFSTVKVHGEQSGDKPFVITDTPHPEDAYSYSKLEAEQALTALSRESGMELVILRIPLVYGAGAGGNFARLIRLVHAGWPLPFAGLDNRRSLIGVENICSCVKRCLICGQAAGRVFLVSDNEDVATPELIHLIGEGMGRQARLFRMPLPLLSGMARLAGYGAEWQRLAGNLHVDVSETIRVLSWQPPLSLAEGIRRAVQ